MNKKTLSTRAIAYVALFIAMQLVLEVLFKVIPGQPEGGSITLTRREQEFPHLYIGGGMNCGKHSVLFCLYYQVVV